MRRCAGPCKVRAWRRLIACLVPEIARRGGAELALEGGDERAGAVVAGLEGDPGEPGARRRTGARGRRGLGQLGVVAAPLLAGTLGTLWGWRAAVPGAVALLTGLGWWCP